VTIVVLATLGFVIFSLGQALVAMSSGPDPSGKMVRALTWRISLSVLIFAVLMIGWWLGFIEPHSR
jgi:hypothetical protein